VPIDKLTALAQIDAVFHRRKELENDWVPETLAEVTTLACAAIKRLAPPSSAYLDQVEKTFKDTLRTIGRTREEQIEFRLHGILRALRADYDSGHLQTFQELIHADLFSDFLEMAEYLREEGYKDPAAVIAGGVLEEHLRKLCAKNAITLQITPKLETMNSELARVGAYNKNDQKAVTSWAALRNDAAHGNYNNYTDGEIKLMIAAIRDFISRNPA
jgi:hypothetical protein